jgi:hypothetical protein
MALGRVALTSQEQKLKDLLLSLSMVPKEDLDRAETDVLLIRRYGGRIDLKLRLTDLGLVQDRQLDAIERGLGMKKSVEPQPEPPKAEAGEPAAAPAPSGTSKEDTGKGDQKFFNVSKLTASKSASDAQVQMMSNLRLDSRPPAQKAVGGPHTPVPVHHPKETASESAPPPAPEDTSGKSGFVPSWKRKAQEQAEEPVNEAEKQEDIFKEEGSAGPVQTIQEQEERLKHFIRHVVKSRTHEAILDFLIKRKMNIVEPMEVAKGLALKEKQVRQILDDLRHSGVIKDIGTHPYALSPGKKELDDMKFFFIKWGDSQWHPKVLTWILAQEKE